MISLDLDPTLTKGKMQFAETVFPDTLPPDTIIPRNPLMGDDIISTVPGVESTKGGTTRGVEKILSIPADSPRKGMRSSQKKHIASGPSQFGTLHANIPYHTNIKISGFKEGEKYTFYTLQDALRPTLPGERIPPQVFIVIREYMGGDTRKGYVKFRGSDGMDYALTPSGFKGEGVVKMSRKHPQKTDYEGKLFYLLADFSE